MRLPLAAFPFLLSFTVLRRGVVCTRVGGVMGPGRGAQTLTACSGWASLRARGRLVGLVGMYFIFLFVLLMVFVYSGCVCVFDRERERDREE